MDGQNIDITNILEITPELKREILWTLRTADILRSHIKGFNYQITAYPSEGKLTIYDRHEGELGFYTHDFWSNGEYEFNFINSEHTPQADEYEKAFMKKYNPRKYKLFYKDEKS